MLTRVIRETVTVILVFAFMFTCTLGNLDRTAFAAEDISSVLIESGDDYKIYQNSDGSKTAVFELSEAPAEPQKEGVVAEKAGEFEYKSKDDTAEVLFNANVEKGDTVAAIKADNETLELIPIAGEDVSKPELTDEPKNAPQPSPEPSVAPSTVEDSELSQKPEPSPSPSVSQEPSAQAPVMKSSSDEKTKIPAQIELKKEETIATPPSAQPSLPSGVQPSPSPIVLPSPSPSTKVLPLATPSDSANPDREETPVAEPSAEREKLAEEAQDDEQTPTSAEANGKGTLKNYSYYERSFEKVLYTDMFGENIDVEYIPITGGFKENIIIKAPTEIDQFQYDLAFRGLSCELFENTILIVDQYGDTKYRVTAPYMEDASGARSYDVKLVLGSGQSQDACTFYVVPDSEWLNDSDRVYPITIDPTVTLNDANLIEDKTITESSPDSVEDYRSTRIRTGGDRGSRQHTYIKPDMSWLGANVLIQSAQLNLTRINTFSVGTNAATDVYLFSSLGNWNVQTITWNNKPGAGSLLDWTTVYGNDEHHLDATAYAQSCFSNGSYIGNNGFVLASYSDVEYKEYGSSDNTNDRLTFTVTYSNMLTSVPSPTVTVHSKGTSTGKGYIDVSWNAISGMDQYYVAIYNGKEYELIDAGNHTSWSSNGKGIWLTQAQIDAGEYHLNTTGGGEDLDTIPMPVYTNSGGTHANDNRYFIKIIPYKNSIAQAAPSVCQTTTVVLPDALGPSQPTLSVVPSGYSNQSTSLLSWSGITDYDGSDFVTDNLANVEYAIDTQANWINTGSTDAEHSNFAIDTSALADGKHPLYVRATDTSSNVGDIAVAYIKIDRTGPDSPSITVISDWYNGNVMNMDWSSVSDLRGLDRLEYLFDDTTTWISTGESTSPFNDYPLDISGLPDGVHTLHFRGVDTCDNLGDEITATLKIDRLDPSFEHLTSSASTWKNTDTVTLAWENVQDATSGVADLAYSIDGGAFTSLNITDTQKVLDVSGYPDGSYAFTLKVVDFAGNTLQDTVNFKLDRTNPAINILDPADGDTVRGLIEIWGSSDDVNLINTKLTAYRYTAEGSLIESFTLLSDGNAHSNDLLGVLDTTLYEEGEKVVLALITTDAAGNATTTETNLTIDSDSIAIDPIITIDEPVKNVTVDEAEERIHYDRESGASGTITEHSLFVDGDYYETETSGHSLKFQSLLYEENSLHSIAVIAENDSGDFEYSQGLARHIVQSGMFTDATWVDENQNIVFDSDGAKLAPTQISGYLVTKPITFLDMDIVFKLVASKVIPSATSLTYEISFDDGSTWETIALDEYYLIKTDKKSARIKVTFNGTSVRTPVLKGFELGGVKVSSKYNVKVKFMTAPQNLKLEENKLNLIKIVWEASTDSEVKYNVYRSTVQDFTPSAANLVAEKISTNGYADTAVSEGVHYYYKVEAFKDFGVSSPKISERVSDTANIDVKAYVTPAPMYQPVYNETIEGDSQDNATTDTEWGDADEIADAEKLNDVYGGDYTVNHDLEPPVGSTEMNESMLGLRKVCAAGFEPINFNTGNFFLNTTDGTYPNLDGLNTSVERTYNAQSDEQDGPFGRCWAFDYATHLKIYNNGDVGMINPDGHLSMFRLSPNGTYLTDQSELQTLTIENGKYLVASNDGSQYIFTSGGLLHQVKNANGKADTLVYDEAGLLNRVELASGETLAFKLDSRAHITTMVLPDGSTMSYAYQGQNLTQFTDAAGNVTQYKYDEKGRMIEWTDPAGVRQVKNIYDENDRITEQWDGAESYYKLVYGEGYTEATNAEGETSTFYFDDYSRTTKIVEPDGYEQHFAYNAMNLVTQYTDQMGKTIDYDYDANGNLIKQTHSDGRSLSFMYDDDNNLIGKSDYLGQWSTFEYDKNKNVIKKTLADNSIYCYEYNSNNQVVKEINPLGLETRYVYRGVNLYKVIDANDGETRNEYDGAGNLVRTVDPKGNATAFEYDALNQLVKTTLADGTSSRFKYDSVGNLKTVYDGEDKATVYEYDDLRNLIAVMNPDGTKVSYAYDKNGNVVKSVEPDGMTTVNEYDRKGNLVSTKNDAGLDNTYYYNPIGDLVGTLDAGNAFNYLRYDPYSGWLAYSVNPEGAKTTYTYDANGNVKTVVYADGTKVAYEYDAMDRVTKTTLPNGAVTTFEYDKLGRLVKGTDANGNQTTYQYDNLDNLVAVTNALGESTHFEYDSNGNLVKQTDANGNAVSFEYNETNQLEKTLFPQGGVESYTYNPNGQIKTVTDTLGAVVKREYDDMGRMISEKNPLGAVTHYEYDVIGNLTRETDADGIQTQFTYDKNGNAVKIVDALGNALTMAYDSMNNLTKMTADNGFLENYVYDKLGRVTEYTTAEGYKKTYEYDKLGRLTKEGDNTGKSVTYTFDSVGNIKTSTNAKGEKTQFDYDKMGNLTRVTYADDTAEQYTYDAVSRLIKQEDREGKITTYTYDKVGNVVKAVYPGNAVYQYTYDSAYNLVKETAPDGSITEYEYDAEGNLLSSTDAEGHTTRMEYNVASMITKVIDAQGNAGTIDYDIFGNVASETDATGNTTKYAYDALQRLTQVTDPLGRETEYIYDAMDNLTAMIDGNGNRTEYAYDRANRLVSETDALGNTEKYSYMGDGLLAAVTKPDGTTSTYSYDLAGRMTALKYSDGTKVSYGHNPVGSVTTMTDALGTSTYQYDDMQRLISVTDSNKKTVGYAYDNLGRTKTVTYPDGKKNTYGYDIMNRITAVRDENGVIAEYGYDDIGQLVSDTRGELATLYDYNDLGQIEEMVTAAGDEALMSFGYTYDANGNITREERREESGTSVRGYAYDAASQLTEMREAGYSEQFTYDNAGNRLTHTVNDTKTEYTYNAANQLTRETQGAKTIEYIHNQNGDLAAKSTGEKYTYDAAGQLTSIKGNGTNQQFTYDGAGNRMSKTVDGNTITYVNDITAAYTQVLQTYDENGAVLNTYDYGVNRIRSRGETDETYIYDGLGSVAGTVNSKAGLISYRYTAYGDLLPQSPAPNIYGYSGEETDTTTGMQYLRARYYDVNLGRFTQKDKARGETLTPQTLNRYLYVGNNPINRIDPSGYGWLSNAWNKTKAVVKKAATAVANTAKKVYNYAKTTVSNAFSSRSSGSNRGNTNYQSSSGGGGGGGSWGNDAYSNKQGQAVKGANLSAPSGNGFHPLAVNPEGKTLGFLGQVCENANKEEADPEINEEKTNDDVEEKETNTFVQLSKGGKTQGDSGLRDYTDKEISDGARDKTIPKNERERFKKEDKIRKNRNKQKRNNKGSFVNKAVYGAVGLGLAIVVIVLVADDITGIGVADDVAIAPTLAAVGVILPKIID